MKFWYHKPFLTKVSTTISFSYNRPEVCSHKEHTSSTGRFMTGDSGKADERREISSENTEIAYHRKAKLLNDVLLVVFNLSMH